MKQIILFRRYSILTEVLPMQRTPAALERSGYTLKHIQTDHLGCGS